MLAILTLELAVVAGMMRRPFEDQYTALVEH